MNEDRASCILITVMKYYHASLLYHIIHSQSEINGIYGRQMNVAVQCWHNCFFIWEVQCANLSTENGKPYCGVSRFSSVPLDK